MVITLISKEGINFPLTKEMAELSTTLQQMSEAVPEGNGTDPLTVSLGFEKKDISKLVKWMELYLSAVNRGETNSDAPLCNWERRFFQSIRNKRLLSVLNLANFLHVSSLLDSGSTYISEKLTLKTVDEARSYLCQKNDFTVEEERDIQEKFGWLVDKF